MMYNESLTNDNLIKAHTSESYTVKDKNRVTEEQNTIVVSKKKHKDSFLQKVKRLFNKK